MTWQTIPGILREGHQVASGRGSNSPYEAGTIALQAPHFLRLGLDLSSYFPGTLNVSIAPRQFTLIKPKHTFPEVKWHSAFAPETFSFSPCVIDYCGKTYKGVIYYPHPETKLGHFQDTSTLEILAPMIETIKYGDRLTLSILSSEVELK